VEFRISRRMLWVDLEAYPLQMITRVRPIEITPNRPKILGGYARRAAALLGLATLGLVFLSCAGAAVPNWLVGVVAAVLLGAFAVQTADAVRLLTRPALYVLSVATAGTARAALVSEDRNLIHDLTRRVAEAIDNPAMEYAIHVDHIEGDLVAGDKYQGDRVDGDKLVFGG
jgi:uncharacterized protein DUF6232